MAEIQAGVICAYDFPGEAAPRHLGDAALTDPFPPEGRRWIHLDAASSVRDWLATGAGLPALVVEAMLDEDTRPHVAGLDEGTLITLRGVNLNAGAEPEEMISLHLWIEDRRVISVRRQKIFAVDALRRAADA